MTMFHDLRIAGIALAAAAIALSAAPTRAEYMQMTLRSAKVTSYSFNGSGLDDLPGPPPKIAAAPTTPQPALNGYAKVTLNGTQMQGAQNGDKFETFDYPGEYAQRFDGIDKGGKNGPITVYGYDKLHRLHRGRQTPSLAQRR